MAGQWLSFSCDCFFPTVGNLKCVYALSGLLYFYDFEELGTSQTKFYGMLEQSSLKPIESEQVGFLIILCSYFAASRHCRLYPNTKCSSTSRTWRTITLQFTGTFLTRHVTHLWSHDAMCLGNGSGWSWGICCRTISCCCSGMDKVLRNFCTF